MGARVALMAGLAVAGCTTDGTPSASPTAAPMAAAATTPVAMRGPTITFESIDGPPMGVFQKLVANLAAEAEARQLMVVSRESQAAYRVRGYLAARVEDGRTHIDWVWDVYDADRHRAFRIAGDEPGAGRGAGDAWGSADDQMLRQIARVSMERLVAFLASPPAVGATAYAPSTDRDTAATEASAEAAASNLERPAPRATQRAAGRGSSPDVVASASPPRP